MSMTPEEFEDLLADGGRVKRSPKDYKKNKVAPPKAQPPVVQIDPKLTVDSVKAVAATLQTTVNTMAAVQEAVVSMTATDQLTIKAVAALQQKVAAMQDRKPTPYKFTINRNDNGFIDSVDAEPI